jgi:hypothetical protein
MGRILAVSALGLLFVVLTRPVLGQSLGNAGTVEGMVLDPSGAAIPNATVTIHNMVSGYSQTVTSAADGSFRLVNIPANAYHMDITAAGFDPFAQDLTVRGGLPAQVKANMSVAGSQTSVNVEAAGDILEVDPSSHVDTDRSLLQKLPQGDPGSSLSQAITYTTGGVAADANGFFHPLGDHAEASFVIDGQPISDQQSKVFSTQLPTSAIQSMEVVTGTPAAEFGDKSSLIANITTRSGLGAGKPFGSLDTTYGSFGTVGSTAGVGFGNAHLGNFLSVDGMRSGRFLDSPEFAPFHDVGNNETIFDHFDYQPSGQNALHIDLFTARNWIQIPNDYDQLSQDQHQRVGTWNIAPGFQHTFNTHMLLTVNPYVRKDEFFYYGSRDPFADTPLTENQSRQLLNTGVKGDLSISSGRHELKVGIDLKQTRLREDFGFGITDPAYNSPCVSSSGIAVPDPALTAPGQCAGAGFEPNTAANPNVTGTPFSPVLLPFDLTRGGSLFRFQDAHNINQYAFYVQDGIKLGNFQFNIGFRQDFYYGLTSNTGAEPRTGIAYNIKGTGTVLRVAYARTFETPFNENLLLSSSPIAASIQGLSAAAIQPGRRNQFNTGIQQAVGKYFLVDVDYFWKYTHNAFDFDTLLNTTITFPIAWHNSKLDGVSGRVSTTNLKGFQAYWNFGHTRARFFPPQTGGFVSQGAAIGEGVFRIDHDQAFQSTGVLRYQRKNREWAAFTWRYDSGMVVSGVPDAGAALIGGAEGLTPNQQVSIGLACNGVFATVANPTSNCVNPGGTMGKVTSTLIVLPQGGYDNFPSQANPDHNPARVQPRNVFNLGLGSDNLFHTEKHEKFTASVDIANLTDKVALYNFLSTFSGTHFLEPRSVTGHLGFVF